MVPRNHHSRIEVHSIRDGRSSTALAFFVILILMAMTLLHSPSSPSLLRERRETTIATVGVWMQCARRKAGPPQYVCKGIRIRRGREGGGQGIKFKSRVERVSQRGAAFRDQLRPSTGCRAPIDVAVSWAAVEICTPCVQCGS